MASRAVRAVLAVYPRAVRERYGDEITEMLADSPRPIRDLIDVAWSALADRKEHLTVLRPRPLDLTVVALLVTPLAVAAVYFVVLFAAIVGPMVVLPGRVVPVLLITNAILLLPVTILAFLWGRRLSRVGSIAAPDVVVPVALSIAFLGWSLVAPEGSFYALLSANSSEPEALAGTLTTVSWCAGLVALAMVTTRLRQAGRRLLAIVVAAAGGLLVLDLSMVVHVLTVTDPQEAPRLGALLWYPAVLLGDEFDLLRPREFHGAFGSMAVVQSVCTVFALTLTAATRRSEPVTAVAA